MERRREDHPQAPPPAESGAGTRRHRRRPALAPGPRPGSPRTSTSRPSSPRNSRGADRRRGHPGAGGRQLPRQAPGASVRRQRRADRRERRPGRPAPGLTRIPAGSGSTPGCHRPDLACCRDHDAHLTVRRCARDTRHPAAAGERRRRAVTPMNGEAGGLPPGNSRLPLGLPSTGRTGPFRYLVPGMPRAEHPPTGHAVRAAISALPRPYKSPGVTEPEPEPMAKKKPP